MTSSGIALFLRQCRLVVDGFTWLKVWISFGIVFYSCSATGLVDFCS